jgi:hypothetical protein
MMQKNTTFTTIFRVKKCHFHYDMQKWMNCIYKVHSKIKKPPPVTLRWQNLKNPRWIFFQTMLVTINYNIYLIQNKIQLL